MFLKNRNISSKIKRSKVRLCSCKLCCYFQVFISKSYDATSHFETTCKDVLDLFQKINNGEPFDFSKCKPEQADE